ncbi:MAG: 3-keto-L-gulonate-6-phosphate decarboxylase UlaD [Spirochaetaceae bacterium]|nr:MAG: 3-keto-L-gulonate-6-phosphate decarboxylase UlaD [Spirochaetaceae bacterium]
MKRPLLQVALDHLDTPGALESARLLGPEVDVLEVGTLLCYAEGARAVRTVRACWPDHILLADLKAADAGGVAAELVFSAGATWMTVICSAPYPTMEAALKVAKTYGEDRDIQVELYGDWTFDHARAWLDLGLQQAVYHRGRDAQAAGKGWDESDLEKINRLVEMGIHVSVTGGLTPDDLAQFRGIPVKAFIAGRSLYGADDPVAAARAFSRSIRAGWS